MKKFLVACLIIIPVVLVIIGIVAFSQLNTIIKTTVEKGGPMVLLAPVTLDEVDLSVFSGEGEIRGMTIGNPEGFKTDNAFDMGSLKVVVDLDSLKTDVIRITSIEIEAPVITVEGFKGANLKQLQANAEAFSGAAGDEVRAEVEKETGKPVKKVIIDRFTLANGKINYAPVFGQSIPIGMPELELTGLGEESGGATAAEILKQVLGKIDDVVIGAVAGAGKLVGDVAMEGVEAVGAMAGAGTEAVGAVGGAAADAVGSAADAGKAALGAIPGFGGNKQAEGAVDETAAQATEAVDEATQKATEAIEGEAKKLVSGLQGLLGKSKKADAPAAADEGETPE